MSTQRTQYTPEISTELRAAFHEGQPDAVDRIATDFFPDVFRFSRSLLFDEELAMEAAQETFLRVVERHRLFDPSRPFRPWLFAISRNCCIMLLRQKSSRTAKVVELADADNLYAQTADSAPSAFETLVREELESTVLTALHELPEAQRSAVFLHLFEDMTFPEIGAVMAMPPASAATIYYRALAELRKHLAQTTTQKGAHRAG